MEAKFTPGPWKVTYRYTQKVVAENGALIATCNRLGSLIELQATARLIAQAPELFRIVSRLADLSDGLNNSNSSAEEMACRLAEQARAAIAKATTGEQA